MHLFKAYNCQSCIDRFCKTPYSTCLSEFARLECKSLEAFAFTEPSDLRTRFAPPSHRCAASHLPPLLRNGGREWSNLSSPMRSEAEHGGRGTAQGWRGQGMALALAGVWTT